MKRTALMIIVSFFNLGVFAQFGTLKKKEDVEKIKEMTMLVVWQADSSYNSAVYEALEKYWNFCKVEYIEETDIKKYAKGDYTWLMFSKSKGTKVKAKLARCEEDFNGLVMCRKYKKTIAADDVIAQAFCSNFIDTFDWETEMIRGVQMLSNYFNHWMQAEKAGDMSPGKMMSNYPSDKNQMLDKKLLVEDKQIEVKKGSKQSSEDVFGDPVEEVDRDKIQAAIKEQDNTLLYFFYSKDEKYCSKLIVSAANSELMYFDSGSADKCKLTHADLKKLKSLKDAQLKKNK